MLNKCIPKLKFVLANNQALLKLSSAAYNFLNGNCKKIKGDKNYIKVKGAFLKNCKIEIYGTDNEIVIDQLGLLRSCHFYIKGDHNRIEIGTESHFTDLEIWVEDSGGGVIIGHNTWITGQTHLAAVEGKKIRIGSNCLFAKNIVIRTGDSHSIFDSTGKRINLSKDVKLGSHVWVGYNVSILKGSNIGVDSVIGQGAIVTKSFPDNCLIAGVPGEIKKTGINWSSERSPLQ